MCHSVRRGSQHQTISTPNTSPTAPSNFRSGYNVLTCYRKRQPVFQDFFTKCPLVFPVPDEKAIRLVELLTKEVIPFFGVPEALLSDCGANLLSHIMKDVCALLAIKNLNTMAYHPQCYGMVERFNRTLKTTLRKHADKFDSQWDRY